jgi:hypothetical protein
MAWPGSKMKGCRLRGIRRVLDHALAAVRGDDAEADARHVLHVVLVAAHHRARVEGGDLVVVVVGGDEACGVNSSSITSTCDRSMPSASKWARYGPKSWPTVAIGIGAAQQLEVVGDVAGAAAELAAHARHQERHVQDVHLVRQDVVLELVREHHDGVEGKGTADQGGHRRFLEPVQGRTPAARAGRQRRAGTAECKGYRLHTVRARSAMARSGQGLVPAIISLPAGGLLG